MTPDEERISAPVLRQAACLSQGEPRQQRTDPAISPSGKGIVESLLRTDQTVSLLGWAKVRTRALGQQVSRSMHASLQPFFSHLFGYRKVMDP